MRSPQFSSSPWLVVFDTGEDLVSEMRRFSDQPIDREWDPVSKLQMIRMR